MESGSDLKLIFVMGASRSGTTMVTRILGRSPGVLAMQELHFFGRTWNPRDVEVGWSEETAVQTAARLLARLRAGVWEEVAGPIDRERARALLSIDRPPGGQWAPATVYRRVVEDAARTAGARYAVEQTPVNVHFMPELAQLFGNAHFVHLVRDPRAVLYSQRHRWRKRWRDARNMPFSEVLRAFVNYHPITMMHLWKRSFRAGELMRDHPRYLRVRYEDLVADARAQVQRLCSFLGVDFDDAMLDIARTGSSHAVSSVVRGFDPTLATAWQGRLSPGEVYLAEALAGDALQAAGYALTTPRPPVWRALAPLALYPVHAAAVWLVNPRAAWAQLRAVMRSSPTR